MNVSAEPNVNPSQLSDYSLVGVNAAAAVEKGLAEAEWYQSPVPREIMRELLVRRDGPAIRDTLLWFALMAFFGGLGILLWGTWWAVIPFALYGILWGSSSDSRWHESSHGTAFRTDWMNNFLYEVSSFMVMRESTVWRWSHTRHHSDTIVVGRDPEIAVPRPPDLKAIVLGFLGIPAALSYFRKVFLHAAGRLDVEEATYIPSSEGPRIFLKARIVLMIYLGVVAISLATYSILPLMLVGLPNFYGAWLMPIYGLTQHAGLAENVLDHRMNCRTVRMNFVNRYLYWNMNFHVEHHMFPLVPYHNLPRLHEVVKADMPIPYASLWDAWKEIVPAVLRQIKDPGYFVKRKLPTPTVRHLSNQAAKTIVSSMPESESGWVEIGPIDLVDREEVIRFDHAGKTFAVYRTAAGDFHATDGICTHGNTHLATGFLKGNLIECPKHNGRFDIRDGGTRRPPVCLALKTYPIRIRSGKLEIGVDQAGGEGAKTMEKAHRFRVVSNENVATFIRELILEPAEDITPLEYLPGQYLQFEIPVYDAISFRNFEIRSPYDSVWKTQHVYDYEASNQSVERRNYSLASNPASDRLLRFNIRIATPPRGQDCRAGIGSSYVWNLRSGDSVRAFGPFGDFRISNAECEMIYLGGGAGMAPLRSHLSYLLETLNTHRKISFWYGARSRQEVFYEHYFSGLEKRFDNFRFHVALSEPLPEDEWKSHNGYIHEVLHREYLERHSDPASVEYYLCGPQPMIQAARGMLQRLGVSGERIFFDEF